MNDADKQVLETMVLISVDHKRGDESSFHYRALLLEGDYTQYRGRCYSEYDKAPEGDEADFWNKIFVPVTEPQGFTFIEIKPESTYVGQYYADIVCHLSNTQKEGRKAIHIRFEYFRSDDDISHCMILG